jgi:peptidoglycan-N-acetylglucosamine deacetylase
MADEFRQAPSARLRRFRFPWIVATALAVVLIACTPTKLPPPPPPPPPPCPGCTVYLTFDDGPSVYTPQILSALEAKGAPATFFVLGEHAVQFPSSVQRASADGDGIGDHTWDHPDLTTLPADQIRQELESTAVEIANLTGARPTLWRPPFGSFNGLVTSIASSLGLSMRLWDVDPADFTMPGTDVIVSRVVDNVRDGAIVLLHDGSPDGSGDRSQTVAALPMIIDTLRARGFQFGTLSTSAGPVGPTGPDVAISRE